MQSKKLNFKCRFLINYIIIFSAVPTPSVCKEGEFQCGDSKQCINEQYLCDHYKHCLNGKDEPKSCGKCFCIYSFFLLGVAIVVIKDCNNWSSYISTNKLYRSCRGHKVNFFLGATWLLNLLKL